MSESIYTLTIAVDICVFVVAAIEVATALSTLRMAIEPRFIQLYFLLFICLLSSVRVVGTPSFDGIIIVYN